MIEVLDAWTGPPESMDRTNVFGRGEMIQFNAVVQADPDSDTNRIRLWFALESLGNAVTASERFDAELIWKMQRVLKNDFTIGRRPAHAFARFRVVEPRTEPVRGDREELVDQFAAGAFGWIFLPGFYRFFVTVGLEEAAAGHPFDMSDPWVYRILE